MPEGSIFKGIFNNLLSSEIIILDDVKAKAGKVFLNCFKGVKRPGSFKRAFSSIKPKD